MKIWAKIAAIELKDDDVYVSVVKTGRSAKVLEVQSARARYTEPENRIEALVAAVRQAVDRLTSQPNAYMLCANSSQAVVRTLRIPFKGRKVGAAVQFELEPYLALPIDELIVDYSSIREVDGETDVLAVAVRRSMIAEQLDILTQANIVPESAGLDVIGLTALWLARNPKAKALNAVLFVRETDSILVVVHDRALAYFRHLPLSGESLRREGQGAAREIQNSLRAFLATWKGDTPLARLTVAGVELFPDERAIFEEAMPWEVGYDKVLTGLAGAETAIKQCPAPLTHVETDDIAGDQSADPATPWKASIGIAFAAGQGVDSRRALDVKSLLSPLIGKNFTTRYIEFRREEFAPTDVGAKTIKHAVFTGGLAAMLLLCFVGYRYMQYRSNQAELVQVGEEIWELYAEAFPKSETVQDGAPSGDTGGLLTRDIMADDFDKYADQLAANAAEIYRRPTLLDVLLELGRAMPIEDIRLTEMRVRPGGRGSQTFTISGEAIERDAYDAMFSALEASEILTVSPDPIIALKSTPEGPRQTFTITITTRERSQTNAEA